MDDFKLLQDYVLNESEDAFALLVSRHVDMVYSVALRRVGNPENAREIAQAVFIILARKSKRLDSRTILPAWLYQTTRLTAAHWLRSERRRMHREQEAYMQSLSNPDEPEIWEKLAPLLEDAIADLGDKDRNAILFRFFQGKSHAEVGTAMGTSEDAAFKRVNRAVEKLRNSFIKRGIAVSAASLAMALSSSAVQAAPVGLSSVIAATATAKGAAVAGSTLSLIKGTLKIMAWTKLKMGIIGGTALVLAFGAGEMIGSQGVELKIRAKVPAASPATLVSTASARTVSVSASATNAPGFRWENIESTDYRQYVANLRAAGFPESVVSDIVVSDIRKNFASRIREILGKRQPYWQKEENRQFSSDQKISALIKEESAMMESLLGKKMSGQALIDQLCLQTDEAEASVAWLSPEKRDAAQRAFAEAGLHDIETNPGNNSEFLARRLALLKGILTPAEMEEYRLRESPDAKQIRQEAYYAELTPDEFKTVLRVREQFGDKEAGAKEAQHQELAKLLGEARAGEILSKSDTSYFWMRQAVEQYDLPVEKADQAFKIKTDMEQAAAKLFSDSSLSQSQQEQQFKILQTTARAAFVRCLGANGAKVAACNSGASWLFLDMNSYLMSINRKP